MWKVDFTSGYIVRSIYFPASDIAAALSVIPTLCKANIAEPNHTLALQQYRVITWKLGLACPECARTPAWLLSRSTLATNGKQRTRIVVKANSVFDLRLYSHQNRPRRLFKHEINRVS